MRFPVVFSRFKGSVPAGQKALGLDTVPAMQPDSSPPAAMDNMLSHRFSNTNGWPTHRIAVLYNCKVGSPTTLSAQAYVFEQRTGRWYAVGVAQDLVDGTITFFDSLGLVEQAQVAGLDVQGATGSEQFMLIITDTGSAAPNGEHQFGMAPDLTTPGT